MSLAELIERTSGWFCHQLPERSFGGPVHFFCARCSGLYAGWIFVTFARLAIRPLLRSSARLQGVGAMGVLMGGMDALFPDVIWSSTNASRFATALLAGMGMSLCAHTLIGTPGTRRVLGFSLMAIALGAGALALAATPHAWFLDAVAPLGLATALVVAALVIRARTAAFTVIRRNP